MLLFQASELLETNKFVSGEQQYNQQLTDERSSDPVNLLVPSFVNNDLSSSLLLGDSGFHYSMLISRGGVQYSKVGSHVEWLSVKKLLKSTVQYLSIPILWGV